MGDLPDDRILNVSENGVYPQNAGFRGTEFSGAEIPGLLQTHDGQIIGLFGAEMGHFYSLSIQFPQLEFRVSINWEVDGNSVLAVTVYIFPSLFFSCFCQRTEVPVLVKNRAFFQGGGEFGSPFGSPQAVRRPSTMLGVPSGGSACLIVRSSRAVSNSKT